MAIQSLFPDSTASTTTIPPLVAEAAVQVTSCGWASSIPVSSLHKCDASTDCHAEAAPAPSNRGVQLDNGTGTVTLPPQGCDYLSPNEVHMIIDGLPPGTAIGLDAIHMDFICGQPSPICSLPIPPGQCEVPGGSLGGNGDCFESTLDLTVSGTGDLTGFNRHLFVPPFTEVHTAPCTLGDPVQSFAADMFRLHGELFGDPDFCTFRVMGGTDFGLPSPGHTILTDLGNGTFNVDSFFDVTYEIEFEGCPGSQLDGYAGITTATIRMETGGTLAPPSCVGDCPPGTVCEQTLTQNPDGTVEVRCACGEPLNPPVVPPDPEHQALKHRYVSMDVTTNDPDVVAWKVELVEYKRCAGNRERACTENGDCGLGGVNGPCDNNHPAVGMSWWVQTPQENTDGCRLRCDTHDGAFCDVDAECPGNDCSKKCSATDQFARLADTPYFSDWTDPRFPLTTLHIGDCEIVPIATYEIRACAPPDGAVCGEPLRIGTIEQPWLPGVRANFGDIVTAPATSGAPYTGPDGITNVSDMQALNTSLTTWPGKNTPQIHVTWTGAHTNNRNPNNCP